MSRAIIIGAGHNGLVAGLLLARAGRTVTVVEQRGELVCTQPFPSAPVYFWNDAGDTRYHAAYFEQFPAQAAIVFEDAVVNHRHLTSAVGLRVGVGFGRRTMGCPPRMTDADRAVQRFLIRPLFQVAELTGGTENPDFVWPHDRDSGRIVAAVLEAAKTIKEDRHDFVRADVTDDAAHA